ncbi:MAG: hypothetical protein QNJ68_02785 [Microcoleaceae cyanobacterium MO_207.B10]|nr:hypothetical protein [Microcoleaceae cyanobacterium MO_207.B10]
MSDSLNIPELNELAWYEKINLAEQLITTMVPDETRASHNLSEVVYATDNLLALTPSERINLAIQLLTEIQQTYFSR